MAYSIENDLSLLMVGPEQDSVIPNAEFVQALQSSWQVHKRKTHLVRVQTKRVNSRVDAKNYLC